MSGYVGAQHEFHDAAFGQGWADRFVPTAPRLALFDLILACRSKRWRTMYPGPRPSSRYGLAIEWNATEICTASNRARSYRPGRCTISAAKRPSRTSIRVVSRRYRRAACS